MIVNTPKNSALVSRSKKTFGAQSGYMLAIMLAVLGLMLVTGVVLSRLMTTSQLTNQLQQAQRGQQQMQTLIGALAAAASDGDSDKVLEAPAAISNGVPPGFGNTKDVFGTAFRYCSYDYGTTNSSSGRIAGSKTNLSSSWITIALISAGPDRVFQTTSCPATDTDVANATALGDDSILTRSYADLGSFGNKTYADKLNAGFGTNKLCRVTTTGAFVCNQDLPSANCAANQRLVFNGSNYICSDFVVADTCAANQWQKWNASTSKFECQTIVSAAACGVTSNFLDAGVLRSGIPKGVRWNGTSLECYDPIGATGDQGDPGDNAYRCKGSDGTQHNPGATWDEMSPTCKKATCSTTGDGTIAYGAAVTTGSCGCTASLPKWQNSDPWNVLNNTMITQHSNGTMECPNDQIAVGVVVSGRNSSKQDTGYEDSRIAVICNKPVLSNCGSGATLNIYNAQYSSSSTDMGANSQGAVDCGNDVVVGLKMTQGGNMDTNKISPKCAKLSINGKNLSLGGMNENASLIDQGSQPIGTTVCANLEVARGFFVKKYLGNPGNTDLNQIKPKCSYVNWQ